MEGAVGERCKAFAAAHRSDEDRQAYISTSRRASSVIAKAKAEAWQTTCSSLSPKSNLKTVYSLLLRSIAGSPSSSSSFPNIPNCSSPRESASVYDAYLVMKIARLTSPPLDVPRRSLPRPRLRHGRRPALLFHLNLILNLCTLFFALLLALLPRLLPLLTFLTVPLPGNRLRSMPLT